MQYFNHCALPSMGDSLVPQTPIKRDTFLIGRFRQQEELELWGQ
jgi:hypothetical protein